MIRLRPRLTMECRSTMKYHSEPTLLSQEIRMPPRIEKQKPTAVPRRKSGNVIDRIAPPTFESSTGLKCLIYGKSKTGKTRTAATFPGPILWIICSGGNRGGELRSIALADRSKVQSVTINNVMEVREVTAHAAKGGFQTLAMDHVSGLQDMALAEAMGIARLPAQMTWGTATREQYLEAGTNCRELLREMLALTCNVVVISQERSTEVDEENELLLPTVGVDIMPSLANWLYPAFDYIMQTYKAQKTASNTTKVGKEDVVTTSFVEGTDFCLRTGPHAIYTTGFRVPKGSYLPDHIVDPTFAKIKTVIDGKWTSAMK